jgi:hypothetical protein
MGNNMHCSSGEDYYESMTRDNEREKESSIKKETEKYFYENGIKYKMVFDSEIRAWVREVVHEDEKEK